MRQIKYRGLRADNKTDWVYGYPLPILKHGDVAGMNICIGYQGGSLEGLPVIAETVGENVGITDMYGNPIYEGDIVRYRYTDERFKRNPKYMRCCVVWDTYNSRWGLRTKRYNVLQPFFYKDHLEVIGNIHQTPDLLDEE